MDLFGSTRAAAPVKARGALAVRGVAGVAVAATLAAGSACRSHDEIAPEPAPKTSSSQGARSAAAAKLAVVEAPASGDVGPIVAAAVSAASLEGRTVVVYVGATWCEPCQRFHAAAAHGDLDAEFPRLTLLEFDLDRDRERLAAAGYVSRLIPLFALPGPGGAASGKQIEGGIKGEGAVGFIAPRLKELLAN
jgi:thiol-disulfide isomerase/thioredoxin